MLRLSNPIVPTCRLLVCRVYKLLECAVHLPKKRNGLDQPLRILLVSLVSEELGKSLSMVWFP